MYYVIRIQKPKVGEEKKSIYAFESMDDAEISYHKTLASDMGNNDLKEAIVTVLAGDIMALILSKHWYNVKPEEPVAE